MGTTADGVLTNEPDVRFVHPPGSLRIVSARFVFEALGSFNSFQWWGELENAGTEPLCTTLMEVRMDFRDVLTVVDADAYEDEFGSSLSSSCIGPGETGLLSGIENDVPSTFLDDLREVQYAHSSLRSPRAVPHPLAPVVRDVSVDVESQRSRVRATAEAAGESIYNLVIAFFGVDACGLVLDEWPFFHLDTVAPRSMLEVETGFRPGVLVEHRLVRSFIRGTSGRRAGALVVPSDPRPDADRRAAFADRWRRVRLAREANR